MNIYALGISHKVAPVELRERVAISDGELSDALRALTARLAEEAVIVSTCNRTEIYITPRNDNFHTDELRQWLCEWKGVDVGKQHFFALHSFAAARHLFEVASGIDSQIIGDIQISGQVKQAYQIARDSGTIGKLIGRLFSTALHTSKRVKTETDLFTGAASVSYAAVELAKKIFYPLHNKRTLVVGAGDTGELTARSLQGQGVRNITITNRTEERGLELIGRLGFGTWMPMSSLTGRLHEFDIVIVSTGAPEYLISYNDVRTAMQRHSGGMQLIVDISVPRNVDPAVSEIPGVFCKDLNDLTSVIESNVKRRRGELPHAEQIISEELADFSAWCTLLPVTPVIAKLRQQSDEIVRTELARNRNRFSESDFQKIAKLVSSVARKIIAMPMGHLLDAEADIEHTLQKAEYVSLLFNLHEIGSEETSTDMDEAPLENGNMENGNV